MSTSTTFTKKCLIPSKRVCLRLKSLREEKNISLETLEKKTKIDKKYLQAIEECRFDDIEHSRVYQKNFIRKYVQSLGEDPRSFISQFETEELKHECHNVKHPQVKCKKYQLSNIPNVLRYITFATTIFLLIFYLGFNVRNILTPPPLAISSPENGYVTHENSITIKGYSKPETEITVNGEPIKNDEEGNFSQNINLLPGINTLTITAKNKHGKTTKEVRNVIYKNIDVFSLK